MDDKELFSLLNSLNADDLEATPTYQEKLVDIADNQLDYPGYLIRILSGADAESMYESYPEICMELTKRFKSRDPEVFMAQVRGMVEKWLHQDVAIEELEKYGLKFVLRGRDRHREINTPKPQEMMFAEQPEYNDPVAPTYEDNDCVYADTDDEDYDEDEFDDDVVAESEVEDTADEDPVDEEPEEDDTPDEDPEDKAITPTAYVYYNGKRMTIDIGIDKKCYWDKYKDISFRQDILGMLDDEAGLFLGFTVVDKATYILIDFNDDVYVNDEQTDYGTRSVYNLITNHTEMKPRDWEAIASRIKDCIDRHGKKVDSAL